MTDRAQLMTMRRDLLLTVERMFIEMDPRLHDMIELFAQGILQQLDKMIVGQEEE